MKRAFLCVACAVALLACGLFASAKPAFAQAPSPVPSASPASAPATGGASDCSLVSADEIAQILGYPVQPPDDTARGSGICFFPSRAVSQEGSASFAIVGEDRLPQLRVYYAALARKCAGVAHGAPNEFICKSFTELAQAKTIDDYFTARTDLPNSEAVKGLGDAAIAAGDALYVRRGNAVYEVVVRRADALDIDRATTLAKLLLSRAPNVPAPEPSPSPRRPKAP